METKRCKICDKEFETNLSFKKYCSIKCQKESRKVKKHIKECPRCNRIFKSHDTRLIHCSISCASRRHNCDEAKILSIFNNCNSILETSKFLNIAYEAVRFILKKHNKKVNNIYTLPLNETQKSLIIGGALGDGHIAKPNNKARIIFRHGPKQYRYVNWKYSILRSITKTPPQTKSTPKAYGNEIRLFTTICNSFITEVHNKLYKNSIKTITYEYLDMLDPFSIATWYMDDGSTYGSYAMLSTHSFTIEENRIIAIWLSGRYKTREPTISQDKRCNKHYILMHVDLLWKLMEEIRPIILETPSMEYKAWSK